MENFPFMSATCLKKCLTTMQHPLFPELPHENYGYDTVEETREKQWLGKTNFLFDAAVFEDVISIFIASAFLKLIQAILDIIFTWKARCTMEYSQKVKLGMKLVFALIWTIIFPVCYANSRRKYTCYSTNYGSLIEEWCFTSYMVAASIYLTTNAIEVVLFFVPAVAKYVEVSNHKICKVLSWWTQPRIYVGRGDARRPGFSS